MIDARADVDPAQRMAGRGGRSVGSLCANAGSSIANWAAGTGAAREPGSGGISPVNIFVIGTTFIAAITGSSYASVWSDRRHPALLGY